MKKNGFTLIELLAVIIVLAVVTLIATPIILNVIEDARNEADMRTVDGLVDGGRQYCANAMFNETAKDNITNGRNVYDDIVVSGSKPAKGDIYVNDKCQVAIKLVQNKKCYTKFFDSQIAVKEESECNDFVGKDDIIPNVELELISGTINDLGWSKEDLKIKVTIKDNESGPSHYKWCSDVSDCTPTSIVNSDTGLVDIKAEGNNKVCVVGFDKSGKESELKCSEVYKIDKTKPTIEGIADITIRKDEVVDLTTGVTVNDSLSGIKDNYDYNPKSVDTTKAGITNITYTVSDRAGNSTEITRKVIVDSEAPTITYTPLGDKINGAGWAKENFIVQVDLVDNSGLGIKEGKWCSSNTSSTCTPIAPISGTTLTPQISLEGSNRICVEATDNNNKTSEVSCSDIYKLDKTAPTAGTATISGTMGSNNWYISNVTITPNNGSDGLSGHSTTTTNISSITSDGEGQTIIITTTDMAGNISTRTQTIKVDKGIPTLTAKSDSITITEGDSVNTSTYFNSPSYSISGGSLSCSPANTSSMAVGQQTVTCTATGGNGQTVQSTKTITVKSKIYVDNSGASIPEFTSKLIPIKYDGSNWVVTDTTSKWYDYTSKEWANAVVLNSGVTKTIGQTVAESEISLWYVWIPRYEYKLPSASIGTTGIPQAIDIKFIDKNKTTADSGYSLHPGFTFGGNNKNGIWIGKFEASTTGNVDTNAVQTVVTRPNVVSWRSVEIANMFQSSRNIESTYGITGMNSHMSKYTEWTAASYLTNSIYGRCSNATTCTEVTINSNSSYYTGGSNYKGNTTQSTTGNITGVYDMVGGAWEYVMGNSNNIIASAGFSSMPEAKYYDRFTTGGANNGLYSDLTQYNGTTNFAAIFKELMSTYTNIHSWYGDYAGSVNAVDPWFLLGGNCNNGTNAGVFASSSYDGSGGSFSDKSFRVVLLAE